MLTQTTTLWADPRLLESTYLGVTVMWQRPCARRPASSRTHSPRPRRRKATAHRCAPHAETLEGRRLLTSISEIPLQAAGAVPVAITKGPGGQMWFIEQASNLIAS